MVVELVVAKVDEQACKVVVLIGNFQTQVGSNRLRHLVSVDANSILAGQTQVVGKTTRQLLHKGIYGAHAETAIIVHDTGHQTLGVLLQLRIGDVKLFYQLGLHRLGVKLRAINDFLQGLHDFGFHLIGGGIGKRDGQDVPIIVHGAFANEAQLQVFLNKREGLPCPCRGLKNLEIVGFSHNNQLFSFFFGLSNGWLELTAFCFFSKSRRVLNERLNDKPKP